MFISHFWKSVFIVLITLFAFLSGTLFAQVVGLEAHKSKFGSGAIALGAYPDKDNRYDVTFYGLDLEVFPSTEHIEGAVRIRAKITEATQEVEIDLIDQLDIDSVVTQSGEKLAVQRSQTDPTWLVTITLPEMLSAGDSIDFTVYYKGTPGSAGFGSFTFSQAGDYPAIWTLSEPFGAKSWFPVKDTPADKADSAWIFVTVPKPLKVASNGLLVNTVDLPDNKTRFEWKTRYPIAQYLISLAIADYQYYEETFTANDGTEMPVVNYIYPNVSMASLIERTSIDETIGIMELLSELFGPYPFLNEKYGHAQFGWSGGMEHQTLSSMGGFSLQLVSHEMAHQWFGDAVTCETWQDIWLNEGFASYAEGLIRKGLPENPEDGEKAFRSWLSEVYNRVTSEPAGQLYVPTTDIDAGDNASVNRIFNYRLTYLKGAAVVHMLKYLLGEEAFYSALREYVGNRFEYSTAKTSDLQSLLEEFYGSTLQWFFDQWVYGQGFPTYNLNYSVLAQENQSSIHLELSHYSSHTSVDFFQMPVQFRFLEYDNGGTIVNDTTIRFQYIEQDQSWEITIPFTPDNIQFDPHDDILKGSTTIMRLDESIWGEELPKEVSIRNTYPNPFNPSTTILYEIPLQMRVTVTIYNLYGKHITTLYEGMRTAGRHLLEWDAKTLASGVYLIVLEGGDRTSTQKVTLIK